jgi:EAL domain-containing protein (putative c-di-GMP-specific phosphodiesterase class I)
VRIGFVLYSQPIINLLTGSIVGQELLIRMRTAGGELIAPSAFIPTAERFGLIHEIDRWVTAKGLRVALGGEPVAINLSGYSIGQDEIVVLVQNAIRDGLDPGNVNFEITETAALTNISAAREFAAALAALGCGLALDDFETGFGSFAYLKHIPARYLKIDIEFVRNVASDETDRQVVTAIVGIAHSLDKLTIAEDVEDAATLAVLRDFDVDYAQDFYLGTPQILAA